MGRRVGQFVDDEVVGRTVVLPDELVRVALIDAVDPVCRLERREQRRQRVERGRTRRRKGREPREAHWEIDVSPLLL
jgi:hypothetical protein